MLTGGQQQEMQLGCTLLGEPLMNLRCATALFGAGFAALAGFVPAAALQTVRAGVGPADRHGILC